MEFKLKIEKLSGHDTEGKVGKINIKAGEYLKSGDVIFTIESGKGALKYISKYNGTIKELNIVEGQVIKKNEIIGSIEGEEVKAAEPQKKGYTFGLAKPKQETLEPDVLIIGGGPGGYVAAIRGAQLGLDVVLIEEDKLGGTCLNYGCIPTKSIAHSVNVLNHIKHAEEYGFKVSDYEISMEKIIDRKNNVVSTLVGGIEHLMSSNNIKVIKGKAVVKDKDTITVNNKKVNATIQFKNLIIAAGSSPSSINIEGADLEGISTSKNLLEMTEVPKSITIIGGGVIGMEFAFILNELGAKVHVVEYMPKILSVLDDDVIEVVKNAALEKGIHIHEGASASAIRKTLDNEFITEITIGDDSHYITSEKVMMAVGRKANLDSLDLEKLDVKLNERKNGIAVNERMLTSNLNIYAIGDITNIVQLAHVASHQGIVAIENIAEMDVSMNYDNIPSAIFTTPEVGSTGITEREAKAKGFDYSIGKFPLMANGKALAMGEIEGFVKLIYDNTKDQIIGGSIVGAHATDMIATVSNLIGKAVTKEEASHIIYAHPTTAESIHEAILDISDRGLHFG
ncbi:dihydrolipoyl dehydrogenase [Oceanirhabdus sp. W0125-5]|uniref:dihydrolipoyl dehydrogenase n=1 Tax=Oceanirhabdus sp. W0125-5 TaxID=2999116 RepID=UPI0022F31B38|nr:dihydrolipoyl dehydrogenase [Oceanirhabdus sp. W0125-5]WBW96417.1 dihydrolipoyl dehydrogenase [Oceanirhabdus sp. W0125-5]